MIKVEKEETIFPPASPGSQYLNSSALSLTVVAVLESEVPIDESLIMPHMIDVLLPLNSRFSSVMSLAVLIMSYMGHLRIAVAMEKDFIDARKFTSCMDKAFKMIHKEAVNSPVSIKAST